MKAFIITMSNNSKSLEMTKVLKESILNTGTHLNVKHFEAIQPPQLYNHNVEIFGEFVPWKYPQEQSQNCLDLSTGLFLKSYAANDSKRVMACALSHMKLWKWSADNNQTITILEHDAIFGKKFDVEEYLYDAAWGVLGLNDPRGNTRKGQLFHSIVSAGDGIRSVPNVDTTEEPPLPMGIAGNSAYVIRPFAARELLNKCREVGLWPNDAVMCKQFFPWLRVVHPYYTNTQPNVSSTTQL